MGDMSLTRRSMNEEPYNYKNKLTMRCMYYNIYLILLLLVLPSLTFMSLTLHTFGYIGRVVLEGKIFL